MDYFAVLAAATEAEVCTIAAEALAIAPPDRVTLLSGPHTGMVMLRVHESVADSQFNVKIASSALGTATTGGPRKTALSR